MGTCARSLAVSVFTRFLHLVPLFLALAVVLLEGKRGRDGVTHASRRPSPVNAIKRWIPVLTASGPRFGVGAIVRVPRKGEKEGERKIKKRRGKLAQCTANKSTLLPSFLLPSLPFSLRFRLFQRSGTTTTTTSLLLFPLLAFCPLGRRLPYR